MSDEASWVLDLLLEQLALEEIDKEDERWLRARLSDAEIEASLSALRDADEALAQRLDHDAQLEQIHAKRRIAGRVSFWAKDASGTATLLRVAPIRVVVRSGQHTPFHAAYRPRHVSWRRTCRRKPCRH